MAQAIADSQPKAAVAAEAPIEEEIPSAEVEQKSAEELLSEFEKMLG